MKNKQYIFCVESDFKSKTDWMYIKKVLDYLNKNKVNFDKYKPLFMNGKGNYNSKSFVKVLNKTIKDYAGESIVIYCVDLDNYHTSIEDKKFYEKIEIYCNSNNYKLVYFSRDIEEVFLGKRVESNNKRKEAMRFSKNGIITNELLERLMKNTKTIKLSNILIVIRECKKE